MERPQPERMHAFTVEAEQDQERLFWNEVLNAFADLCDKSEELDFFDEVADLQDLTEHEALGALYDRLSRIWEEVGEDPNQDPDDFIALYDLFVDQ